MGLGDQKDEQRRMGEIERREEGLSDPKGQVAQQEQVARVRFRASLERKVKKYEVSLEKQREVDQQERHIENMRVDKECYGLD